MLNLAISLLGYKAAISINNWEVALVIANKRLATTIVAIDFNIIGGTTNWANLLAEYILFVNLQN